MRSKNIVFLLAVFALLGFASFTDAHHSWGGFHWARKANPLKLELGDNVDPTWDIYLRNASKNWNPSFFLDTVVKEGKTNWEVCRPTLGRVEVCSGKYGETGWLGLTHIWVTNEHITQSVVQVNNTYFHNESLNFNTPSWKTLVLCHEIGHTFGLDHQDEDFFNPNISSCLDFAVDPTGNERPNEHDFQQLREIYTHLDNVNTAFRSFKEEPKLAVSQNADLKKPAEWGKEVKKDLEGKHSEYERDFGKGEKLITYVTWVK